MAGKDLRARRISVFLKVDRLIETPRAVVRELLTGKARWPDWGPTTTGVEVAARKF